MKAEPKFPVIDVINAIEKNGYRKATGSFWKRSDNGTLIAACALGQASINLGIGQRHFEVSDGEIDVPCPICVKQHKNSFFDRFKNLRPFVMHLNDSHRTTIPQIVEILKETYSYGNNEATLG